MLFRLYRWLSILHSKNFNVEHYVSTFLLNFFLSAMLIDLSHFFVPLSQALTLAEGHKVSGKQNPVGSLLLLLLFCTLPN